MIALKKPSKKHQFGVIGVVFLAVALIGVVIAAVSTMNRDASRNDATQGANLKASVLIKQAADIRQAFDRKLVDGISVSSIRLDTTGNGIYYTGQGRPYAVRQYPPKEYIVADAPLHVGNDWNYFVFARLPAVGTFSFDYVISVGALKPEICRSINRLLYNDPPLQEPAQSNVIALRWWSGGPSSVEDWSVTAANYSGRPEGCVRSSDGFYVYYKTMAEF